LLCGILLGRASQRRCYEDQRIVFGVVESFTPVSFERGRSENYRIVLCPSLLIRASPVRVREWLVASATIFYRLCYI